jgi:ferric-dicitrate binding protein FerR (iron transport regulator)
MTEIDKSELRYLLQKEALDDLTAGERRRLDEWYDAFDTRQKDLKVFRDADHEQKIRQRLLDRIMMAEDFNEVPEKSRFRRLRPWLSAAAAIALIAGCALLWPYTQPETLLTVQTGSGMLKEIKLEDGSEIWLNAGSSLRYPKHFSDKHREVYLDGEAYFDIVHNPDKAFVVHAAHLNTNVLGTAFSVTAYKGDRIEAVTVIRGKVGIAEGKNQLGSLTPNNRVSYDVASGKSIITNINAAALMSWKEGKLQFENQDMQDIAGRLGRWYGYKFSFTHVNLKNCRYTASFNNNIPLENLLKVMKAISLLNYRVDEKNKTVTFLGTGCNL